MFRKFQPHSIDEINIKISKQQWDPSKFKISPRIWRHCYNVWKLYCNENKNWSYISGKISSLPQELTIKYICKMAEFKFEQIHYVEGFFKSLYFWRVPNMDLYCLRQYKYICKIAFEKLYNHEKI